VRESDRVTEFEWERERQSERESASERLFFLSFRYEAVSMGRRVLSFLNLRDSPHKPPLRARARVHTQSADGDGRTQTGKQHFFFFFFFF
jgi:hypothetical protein